MGPAAVLKVLVQAQGITETHRKLQALDAAGSKTADGLERSTKRGSKAFGALGKAAKVGVGGMVAGAAILAPKLIDLASDAEETASKFKTVFGKETANATEKLDAFSKATGTSKFALRDQAAQFQALIRPMGLSTKNAAGMSVGMTQLATDLASFNNTSVQDAIVALQSGLVGEAEPMRKFGVQLSATRVQAFAYAHGIAKQGKELTAAQKAQASYQIILKDTKLAQGDATRTADSFANQWKRLKSQVTDTATEIGMKALPVVTKIVGAITGFIGQMRDGSGVGGKFKDAIVNAWNFIRDKTGAAITAVRGYLDSHREDIDKARETVVNIGKAVKFVWDNVVFPVVKRVLPAIVQIIKGAFEVIKGVVKVITGVLTGDFRRAWDGVKNIFSGAIEVIKGYLRAFTAPARELVSRVGGAMVTAFEFAWGKVKDGVRDVKSFIHDRWEDIKGGFQKGKDAMVKVITAPFRAAVSAVGGFAKFILKIVDKIPGVDMKGPIASIDKFVDANGLARGGAFARTGGLVSRPITLMGEEAPRHPEFVIPTNPAYRKRAQGLLGQAAGAIGMANGGIFQHDHVFPKHSLGQPGAQLSPSVVAKIAEWAGLPGQTFEQIAHGESDYHPGIVSSDGGWGLWQMTPRVWGSSALTKLGKLGGLGQMLNPFKNARMAKFLYDAAGGISPWFGTKYVTGTAGVKGGGPSLNPFDFISKLPGVGNLPDWIGGLGTNVLGSVKDWIMDTVGGIVGGGAGIGGQTSGTMKMANTVAKKFGLHMTSGYRTPEHNRAVGGVEGSLHTHGTPSNPGAIDLVGTVESMNAALTWVKQNLNLLEAMVHDVGSGLHLHMGFFKKGGLFGGAPFVGSYKTGGTLPADGLYYGHRGETVTPAGRGGPLVHIDKVEVRRQSQVEQVAARLAHRIATSPAI